MIARWMREWRWTVTSCIRIESCTSQYECTRVPGERIERTTLLPETMQPIDTSDCAAVPRRPSSSNTNLAGGNCGWYVRSGHSGS